jgi:phospholipid-binding lipoprotein MlaA
MKYKISQGFFASILFILMLLCTNSYAGLLAAEGSKKQAAEEYVEGDTAAVKLDNEENATQLPDNKDPLEKFNRAMFKFNDAFDIYFMKPIAELYNAIMPKPLNKGVHNFLNNLNELPIIANDLLQFNFYQMSKDVSRLVINTTMGIGGLFDMASRMHLPYFQNDFGLTLARWGYKDSSYLVIPFLGSNTIRDGIGIPVDYYGFSVYPRITPDSRRYALLGLFFVDYRANLLQYESVLEEAAIDKYVFMRNAYMQHRAYQIEQLKHLSFKDRNQNAMQKP